MRTVIYVVGVCLLLVAVLPALAGTGELESHDVAVTAQVRPSTVVAGAHLMGMATVTNLGDQPDWVKLTGWVIKGLQVISSTVRFVQVPSTTIPDCPDCPECLECNQVRVGFPIKTEANWDGEFTFAVEAEVVTDPIDPQPLVDDDPSNNVAQATFIVVTRPPRKVHDIAISSLVVEPATIHAGQTAWVKVTIKNTGTRPEWVLVQLRVFRHNTDSTVTVLADRRELVPVGPIRAVPVWFPVPTKPDTPQGVYQVTAHAEMVTKGMMNQPEGRPGQRPREIIPDPTPADNDAAATLTVIEPLPVVHDVALELKAGPETVPAGTKVMVCAKVTNKGTVPEVVRVTFSANLGSEPVVRQVCVAPGKNASTGATFRVPANLAPGSYTITAHADILAGPELPAIIPDANPADNDASVSIQVVAPPEVTPSG